jgi:hypothetical protein
MDSSRPLSLVRSRLRRRSIQADSEALRVRIAVGQRAAQTRGRLYSAIVLLDPPFAYGRQMVVADALGRKSRVPFDAEEIARHGRRAA